MRKHRFIDSQKATRPNIEAGGGFPIWLLCQVLEVPESSYYDWHRTGRARQETREAAASAMTAKIAVVHAGSDGTYGAPRIRSELNDAGVVVSKRRVAELMAASDMKGLSGREHSTGTTRRDRMAAPFPDLVNRRFLADRPDVVWYGDIERHEAFLNLAVVKGHRHASVAADVLKLRAA